MKKISVEPGSVKRTAARRWLYITTVMLGALFSFLPTTAHNYAPPASAPTTRYMVEDLGTLGDSSPSYAVGINNAGQVAGYAYVTTNNYHPFRWSNGVLEDLGTLGGASNLNYGLLGAINDAGQVTGYTLTAGNADYHAFRFTDGAGLLDLGGGSDPEFPSSQGTTRGRGINNLGEVVGDHGSSVASAFYYDGAALHNLDKLVPANWRITGARAINDARQICGLAFHGNSGTAYLYTVGGAIVDLGAIAPGGFAEPFAINASGQVAGGNVNGHAFVYNGSVVTDLGALPNHTLSEARGINAAGIVVGYSIASAFSTRPQAVIWKPTGIENLNDLIDPALGWSLQAATGINDAGQICGYGDHSGLGIRAFRLTPAYTVSGRVTDANGNGVSGVSIALSGSQSAATTTDASGGYSFSSLAGGGTYTVTPALANTSFSPPSKTFNGLSADQTANFTATLINLADLSITQSATPGAVVTGSNITYTLTVTNNGPAAATAVAVTDDLPAATSFVACSATNGGVCGGSGNKRSVSFASLAPKASATISLVAAVNCSVADQTAFSNPATVSAKTTDPVMNNNSATTTVAALNPAPTISCSSPIAVEFTSAEGAAVTFSPPVVTDNCPGATVACTPPSGGTFAIGTTMVICQATDAAGNTATCGFTVTVKGPRGVIQDVLDELLALRGSLAAQQSLPQSTSPSAVAFDTAAADSGESEKLDDAIQHLRKALNPAFWIDQTHLQPRGGEKVFDEDKDAVNKLRDLLKDKRRSIPEAVLQGFLMRIVRADRLLALVAINDSVAAGLDPNEIANARGELGRGDKDVAGGRYESGIDHYREAWQHACRC